jgi:hypothetical protein
MTIPIRPFIIPALLTASLIAAGAFCCSFSVATRLAQKAEQRARIASVR